MFYGRWYPRDIIKEIIYSHDELNLVWNINQRESGDSLSLGFRDHEKVDEILNDILLLIVTSIIDNHIVSGLLVENKNSCILLYLKIFKRLGLRMQDLKSYEDPT